MYSPSVSALKEYNDLYPLKQANALYNLSVSFTVWFHALTKLSPYSSHNVFYPVNTSHDACRNANQLRITICSNYKENLINICFTYIIFYLGTDWRRMQLSN